MKEHIGVLLNYEAAMEKAKKARTKEAALRIIDEWARSELKDRRVKVTDEQVTRVRLMAADGEHIAVIADTLDISEPTVRRILKGVGRYAQRASS